MKDEKAFLETSRARLMCEMLSSQTYEVLSILNFEIDFFNLSFQMNFPSEGQLVFNSFPIVVRNMGSIKVEICVQRLLKL